MATQHDEKRVAAGLKAAINNPNVSEEARKNAQERLDQMGEHDIAGRTHPTGTLDTQGHETNRVLGGYKATLHNPRTSDEAKRHAREILEADGYTVEPAAGVTEDEHQTRVLAGYKAALHNPRVSKEAKEHAKEYLAEYNAL
ncbi:Conidiation protein 6-domain-containing protein [Ganoderma leucocontextum]|nr:Conidiation protein 6-domain-containing protein [Ganoderma leucocontextum]